MFSQKGSSPLFYGTLFFMEVNSVDVKGFVFLPRITFSDVREKLLLAFKESKL